MQKQPLRKNCSWQRRATVPDAAFETDVASLGLPEHVYTILTEAEHRSVGDLMMAIKLNPDSILSLAGIGPKSMQAIEKSTGRDFLPGTRETSRTTRSRRNYCSGGSVGNRPNRAAPVVEEVETAPEEKVEEVAVPEEAKEEDFDKIFSLQNVIAVPVTADEESEGQDKKKRRKPRKAANWNSTKSAARVVARKKHKRGDDESVEEWE